MKFLSEVKKGNNLAGMAINGRQGGKFCEKLSLLRVLHAIFKKFKGLVPNISAWSVVYGDVLEYSVYGGDPAVFIKEVPRNSR